MQPLMGLVSRVRSFTRTI